MSEHSKLVAQLQKELSLEHDSRRRQQELNAKLQHEYDVLLKKLAEAELHIDKLRLGANVELNKWYVLRYATEQNSTLRQRLEAEFDPSSRAAGTGYQVPSPHEEPHTEQRIEAETIVNIGDGGVRSNASVSGNANDSHTISDTSLLVSQCSESNVLISPQPLENGLDTNVLGGLHNGLLEQANTWVDGSCSQLSLLHLSSHSSSAHLSSHATDSDELCISQMSAGTIATCGSAESMLLAHLLQLHSLQEQLTALKLKINEGGASLDEILSDLSHIQDGHRQLSSDIDISSGHLDRLKEKYNGKDFDHIARSREAVGKELANLSTQLQELGGLIRTKTPELSQKNDVPPSSSATESVLLSHTGKQGTDSDSHMSTFFDSLNSPALPTKYLSQDVIASPIKEEPLMTGLPLSIPQSVAGTQSSVKTDPLSSVSRDHFMNAKSHSTISGTPLEELLGVAGRGLNVESCEDTLSNLSDILPSDTRSENSQDEVLKEAKQNLERAEMFRLENRYPTQSQVQPSTPSHASHITSAASPLTNVNDQYQSSNNPLLVRHSTPASHYQAPPTNHTPLTAHSQPQNDPNNPLSPFTHRHTLPSPFPRPQTTDSGFAGSEFPSRAGKINVLNTVDSPQKNGQDSIPYQQLVEESSKEESVSLLTEADKELSVNSVEVPKEDEQQEKRPSLTVAAIDSLRNELASLKEQIMQTVQQQKDYASLKLESHSRSPLIHSHSSLRGEPRRPSTTSSSNTTATPSHNYNTEHKVPARSTTIPQTMPGLVTDPLNHDTCSNESYTSHSPSSVPHTDDRRSLNSTPKRHYTSRPSSMVSFTPSTRYQDTHTQYVSTPTKTVTPFGTPLPTLHILGLNSHKRDRPSSGEPPQEWISDGGSPFIAGQTCPRCGEQSVQVSSREKTSEDGSKRHRYVTYVHSCRSNVGGTPLRDSGGLRNSNALINSSGESNTVVGKSVMPDRDSEYETHQNGVSIEDGRIPTATSTPSRFRGSISRSVFTETAAKGRQRAAASRSEGEIGGLYDNENHHWEETTFRNITPKCRTTHTEATRRPSYTAYTTRRETNSSSTNSSPTYTCMYKSSPERSSSSVHTSPHHTHPTELYRRGSTPAAFATSTASYTGPSHVHHARLYHTPTSKQQVKVHHYPLSSGSNRYKVRYAPSERRDQQHPQVIHTSSARKPSTRNSIPENSPEYHPYTSQLRTTSQRSKSRRKVVRLIPAIPSDEVCYSEPGVKIRNKRQRKRRHFVDHGDSVRGVYVKPRQVYVVEGEECSSDSERDVEVDGMELEEIMELARGLKRRSCRMQTSLQAALNKRGVY